ncbi:hypothetical protein GCM10009551_086140 [Nocardiopsis tropica]
MTRPERDHGAASLEILPVFGIGEVVLGDDVSRVIADAAPWLADGDVVVITSKIFSKAEGRVLPAPSDPEERDAFRRRLIADEAVRVLATKGRTWITENKLGVVQAASGVDASNVASDTVALLPEDPDGSAAAVRSGLRERLGVDVAVLVTDTMGRAWRTGQTDAAIGAAGMEVLHGYAGAVDSYGNDLVVTEIAVADELAAAADLVKGKLGGVPVAVVRGFETRSPAPGSPLADARGLVRPGEDDLFHTGVEAARRQALLLRRGTRARGRGARRRGRGAHRPRAAPHASGAVRVGARSCPAGGAAGRDEGRVVRGSQWRRPIGGVGCEARAAWPVALRCTGTHPAFHGSRWRPRLPGRSPHRGRGDDVHGGRRRRRAVLARRPRGPRDRQLLGGFHDLRR